MIDKSASDLTKRLYETPLYYGYGEASALGEEAADEITALTAEVERLMAELRTAADMNVVYEGRLQEKEAENERLTAVLRDVMDDLTLIGKNHWLPIGLLDDVIYVNARAALKEPRT